jgi:IclR family KDG regulon transcriptional repressor
VTEISKTADQALAVLLKLSESSPMNSATISRSLGINRTVVHRLLATMQARGFVTRTERGYLPGAVLVRVAERVQPELRAATRPAMTALTKRLHETVVVHIADADEAVVLDQSPDTSNFIRVQHQVGSRHPLAVGASGRALLAYLPAATQRRVVAASADPDALTTWLEQIRSAGYSESHDELQQGVYGLAVPILNGKGIAVASLAVLIPSTRAENIAQNAEPLKAASSDISERLAQLQ